MFPLFTAFSKIPRLYSECRITEKLDGTNACVEVVGDAARGYAVAACSRSQRLVTVGLSLEPEWHSRTPHGKPLDNYGFGAWVVENAIALTALGPGRHFGEWWGAGIQRKYGLTEKRFSAFWRPETAPACVGQVPVMYEGVYAQAAVDAALAHLMTYGSWAAPDFTKPEGVVVAFKYGGSFKVILDGGVDKRADAG